MPGEIKRLDAEEFGEISAACSVAQSDADYERILNHYLYLTTGSNEGVRVLALDSRYSQAVREGVYLIFAHSTPEYEETADAKSYLMRYCGRRFPSIKLLRSAYAAYLRKGELAADQPAQPTLSEEDRKLQQAQELANQIARSSWDGI